MWGGGLLGGHWGEGVGVEVDVDHMPDGPAAPFGVLPGLLQLRVQGLGFGVWGLGFGVWGLGFEVWG